MCKDVEVEGSRARGGLEHSLDGTQVRMHCDVWIGGVPSLWFKSGCTAMSG